MATKIYKPSLAISEEEKKRIHNEILEAQNSPIEYDDDCPKLNSDMLKQLKAAVRNRNRTRKLRA